MFNGLFLKFNTFTHVILVCDFFLIFSLRFSFIGVSVSFMQANTVYGALRGLEVCINTI